MPFFAPQGIGQAADRKRHAPQRSPPAQLGLTPARLRSDLYADRPCSTCIGHSAEDRNHRLVVFRGTMQGPADVLLGMDGHIVHAGHDVSCQQSGLLRGRAGDDAFDFMPVPAIEADSDVLGERKAEELFAGEGFVVEGLQDPKFLHLMAVHASVVISPEQRDVFRRSRFAGRRVQVVVDFAGAARGDAFGGPVSGAIRATSARFLTVFHDARQQLAALLAALMDFQHFAASSSAAIL